MFYRRLWNPFIRFADKFSFDLWLYTKRKRSEAKERGDLKAADRWKRVRNIVWDLVCGGPVTSMRVERFLKL